MLNDFHRALDFSRIRTREYNREKFNHEATTWIVAGSLQENFRRPISGTINDTLQLQFHDEIPQRYAKDSVTFLHLLHNSSRRN